MHYGRVTMRAPCSSPWVRDPFLNRWTRSMCLSRLIARGCSDSYCTDHRRGDRVRPLAAFRGTTVRLNPLPVKENL